MIVFLHLKPFITKRTGHLGLQVLDVTFHVAPQAAHGPVNFFHRVAKASKYSLEHWHLRRSLCFETNSQTASSSDLPWHSQLSQLYSGFPAVTLLLLHLCLMDAVTRTTRVVSSSPSAVEDRLLRRPQPSPCMSPPLP